MKSQLLYAAIFTSVVAVAGASSIPLERQAGNVGEVACPEDTPKLLCCRGRVYDDEKYADEMLKKPTQCKACKLPLL